MCVKHYKIIANWVGAKATCQNDGGQLVSITTVAQWKAMSYYLGCKWNDILHQYRS